MEKFMTGNEAVAQGTYEAGVSYAAAYPGTPSTEVLENISLHKEDIVAEWAPNEKVALDGSSYRRVCCRSKVFSIYETCRSKCGSRSYVYICLYGNKWGDGINNRR